MPANIRARGSTFGRLGRAMRAGVCWVLAWMWPALIRRHRQEGCLFCQRDDPAVNRILGENRTFYARYDNYPAAKGHIELVPKRHVESYFDLYLREVKDAYRLIRKVRTIVAAEGPDPDGYTIGVNEGRAAGRTIDHLHIHLIPRMKGDVRDPRGGVRCVLPTRHPDEWSAQGVKAATVDALTRAGR